MKLELGAGKRPTPGYEHNDLHDWPDIEHVGPAWELDLPDGSVEEIVALAFMEHLTYQQFDEVLANARRMLQPGGSFLFDVPDLPVWARYLADSFNGGHQEFTQEHIYKTIYGHQRWPGDEHQSGWDHARVAHAVMMAGYTTAGFGVARFIGRGLHRDRFYRPLNAHIYVEARK